MRTCKGCGAVLQTENPDAIGYTPKAEAEYCKRCFRLIHYDDLTVSMRTGIDPDSVMDRIAEMDCLVLWVVDLADFEGSMIPGLNRKLAGKDIIMAAAKRDILPDTLSHDKIARFVFSRLKEQGISIRTLILTSKVERTGTEEIKDAVNMFGKGRPVAVMGRANAGKSTLLNSLAGEAMLTMSRYPGTTLDFNEINVDGQIYIDTPGIEITGSLLMEAHEEDLKQILPARTIKPQIFQLKGDQSFAVGGLARLDLSGCDHASCVWYLSDALKVHRSKISGADELWAKHYGGMLKPVAKSAKMVKYSQHKSISKLDIVIDGLGWACVSGQIGTVTVMVPENVNVTFRKAMI